MNILELFQKTVDNNASDLHFMAGVPPVLRIDGKLIPINTYQPLTKEEVQELIFSILTPGQKEMLINNKSIDFSYGYGGGDYGDKGRFRINAYYQRGTLAAACRLLPSTIKTIEELGLPKIIHKFSELRQGLVLVTGPTGQGKSTTLASILNEINMTKPVNIITIEDPIEYMYPKGQSLISQRELGLDTHSWGESLKSILREDPDVVLVGEMRDPESIASTITIAETGHVVFSTLHTNSASQSIDRIIDSFPEHQQNQIKVQLAEVLEGIVSQRLIPMMDGGRAVATEILLGTTAVRSNIREGKTHLIDSIIETSSEMGMRQIEHSLAELVTEGKITVEMAKSYSFRPDVFNKLFPSENQ